MSKFTVRCLMTCLTLAVVLPLVAAAQAPSKGKKDGQAPDGFKALKHEDPAVRYKAVALLGRLGKNGRFAMPFLRTMLKDPHPAVRVKVVETLWKVEKTPAIILLPVLEKSLADKDAKVRAAALVVCSQMGGEAKSAASDVIKLLKDKDFNVRFQAILAVSSLGPFARAAVPELINLLRSDDTGFLEATITVSLSKIGTQAVTKLSDALGDKDVKVRRGAAFALGLIGPRAARAVPALTTALGDKEKLVRSFAAQALGRVGPRAETAVPALRKVLAKDVASVRVNSALALWQIGESTEGVKVLGNILINEKDNFSRQSAAKSLGIIGPAALPALGALAKGLEDGNGRVREQSVIAIGKVGPKAKAQTDRVTALLTDKNAGVRIQSSLALWRISKKTSPKSLKVLEGALLDELNSSKISAANAAREMGPAARSLTGLLLALARSQNPNIRDAGLSALQTVAPDQAKRVGNFQN